MCLKAWQWPHWVDMATGWIKFLVVKLLSLGFFLLVVPQIIPIEINITLALVFFLVSSLIGFVVVLLHKRIIKSGHIPFLLGLITVIGSGLVLYGGNSFPYKTETYWNLSTQANTILLLVFGLGFLIMILGGKRMWNR